MAVSRSAELAGSVYPYRYEEWLRYYLPTLWPADGRLLLITGPSTAREGIDADQVQAAFPQYRVYNGAISAANVDDILLSLEFVERSYGSDALPRVIVLGIEPRFLLDLPRYRPLAPSIDRYSPDFAVTRSEDGYQLTEKSDWQGLVSRARFLATKQSNRFSTALAWWVSHWIGSPRGEAFDTSAVGRFLQSAAGGFRLQLVGKFGLYGALVDSRNHYRYFQDALTTAELIEWMDDPQGWWPTVHGWDPSKEWEGPRDRINRLLAFVREHRITLIPIILPEHRISRERYPSEFEASYATLLDELLPMPVLNLRCFLGDEDFFDMGHVLRPAAHRQTGRIVGYMQAALNPKGSGIADPRPWNASCTEGGTG
jgi:hypothetical protein